MYQKNHFTEVLSVKILVMLLGWSQSLDLMKTISREKQFSHLKTDYFVCRVVDVTCQTTGHCIWHPAWNETSGFVGLFSLYGEKRFWRLYSFHQTMSVWKGISRFVYLWPEKCSFQFYTSFGLIPPQFYDLEELFNTGGQVPDTSYVFMVSTGTIVL